MERGERAGRAGMRQAFFQRWWNEQPESVREKTRRLVTKGQVP